MRILFTFFAICLFKNITIAQPCSGTLIPGVIHKTSSISGSYTNYTLTDSGYSAGTGLTFQWQASLGCTTWTNISGATNHTYTYTLPTSTPDTICYCIYVTCSNTGLGDRACQYPTNINSVQQVSLLTLVPNPVSDRLTIKAEGNVYSIFTITNMLGQKIIQSVIISGETNIDIAKLPAGVYYVTLKGEGIETVKRFVKI